jgi:mono/diheme cytochrome c family protein
VIQRYALRSLPALAKLGLSGLLIALLMGMATSAMHLYWHYENRDERPGLTKDDITGAYHGINTPSPLLAALERNHPEDMAKANRDALIAWLRSPRIAEDYDSLDLAERAPAEIMAASCLKCHSRQASSADAKAKALPLDYWDDVKKVAFSRDIRPMPAKVTAMSMHAHAISLGIMSIVLSALALASGLPRALVNPLIALTGVALALDLAAWWLARQHEAFVHVIIGAGALYNGGSALLMLLVLLDLWLPRRTLQGALA